MLCGQQYHTLHIIIVIIIIVVIIEIIEIIIIIIIINNNNNTRLCYTVHQSSLLSIPFPNYYISTELPLLQALLCGC